MGPRVGQLLRPADRGRRRHARRAPGALRVAPDRPLHHQLRATAPRPGDRSAAGRPTWSCSTRRSGSRTGRPRRRSRSRGSTPPYRLVLTGTPMENRIEELASVVEWVDDMALEPKWRLGALHAVRADGRSEVTGVRHLDTLRERLRPLHGPPGPPGRARPAPAADRHPRPDRADRGAAGGARRPDPADRRRSMQRSKTRPLTQAEFLRLMSLLTTQRIISNGLAQLHFEEVWPAIRALRARGERDQGPLVAQAPGAPPARPPARARAGAQGRRLQPVAADAHPGALGGERPARRAAASAPGSSPAPRGRSGGPRTSSSSTTTRASASSSPATPAASA